MGLDYAGSVFTGARGDPLEGTLPMSALGAASELAPDIIFTAHWDDEPDQFGAPGTVYNGTGGGAGPADHGSLSPWDVRNTLVAAGAGIKQGLVSELPAATIDIAPTLAALLGLESLITDGRVLIEALEGEAAPPNVERSTLSAESGSFGQMLQLSRVGSVQYVDYARRLLE